MIQARSIVGSSPLEPKERLGLASSCTPGLSDGLGDRLLMFDDTAAATLELLRFRRAFGESPAFEAALRQRVEELKDFAHPSIATIRSVQRLGDDGGLTLVSDHVTGRRLSEVLHESRGRKLAVELLRQLTPVLASMHRHGDGIAHGALSADRIVVTPEGRLVIVEHVLGSALAALHLPADSLRSELGLPVPPRDFITLDARTDVAQLAFVALSLLLGRRIDPREYTDDANLVDEFAWASQTGFAIRPQLRRWLERALQTTGEAFDSAQDARLALGEFLEIHDPPAEKAPPALHVVHPSTESSVAPIPILMLDSSNNSADFLGEEEVGSLDLTTFRHRRDASAGGAPALTTPPAPSRETAYRFVDDADFSWPPAMEDEAPPQAQAGRGKVVRWALAGCIVLAAAEGGVIAVMMRVPPPVSPAAMTAAVTIESRDTRRGGRGRWKAGRRHPVHGGRRIRHAFNPRGEPGGS